MKTILMLIAMLPNGAEHKFPIAEVYHGQAACELMIPGATDSALADPALSALVMLTGAEVRLECITRDRG